MEKAVEFLNYGFEYPGKFSLKNINISVNRGELLLLYGRSGSGKSTLLRSLKPTIRPNGKISGGIKVFGKVFEQVFTAHKFKPSR